MFKGSNFRHAAARYQKALTHASKFFDLSAEEETEIRAVKLSLHLNLAQCYIKMENWDQVIRNCDEALAIDGASAKAFFRRATAYEKKRDFPKAEVSVSANLNKLVEIYVLVFVGGSEALRAVNT